MPPRTRDGLRNPAGWYTLPVEVVTNGTFLMIVGDPPSEEDDPDCEAHHCDSAGCGLSHVLLSIVLDEIKSKAIGHMVREAIAKEEAAKPKPSLREAMIARKGLAKPDRWADTVFPD